ncbi:MAG TPA: ABC transporter ATP-binding protein, partial [Phycisphaerae bacterium]|nr:ABC transporter ATP-binding protein [Phycisphaerae bacterium]
MPDNQANEDIVVARNLTKVFKDFWLREKVVAVSDLDLHIRAKEVFAILGPNGSGKSTVLKMLLGLLFPTRGKISVFSHPPTDVRTKGRIGYLPEESYLYGFMDARETLDYFARLFRQPRRMRRARTESLLEMVGLRRVAHRRVGEYSKGMQRRLGLAQALINDPDLLILDEPTSGMDPLGTKKTKDLIRTLAERGKTVILSSHLLGDVEDVCDRVTILYGGKQRRTGTIEELLARQDRTRLIMDHLDESEIKKVEQMLQASGHEIHEVSAPHDRLENLFLRIVNDARTERLSTGGALAGGAVADFLRHGQGDEGRDVIDNLVAAGAPEPVTQEADQSVAAQGQTADEEPLQ